MNSDSKTEHPSRSHLEAALKSVAAAVAHLDPDRLGSANDAMTAIGKCMGTTVIVTVEEKAEKLELPHLALLKSGNKTDFAHFEISSPFSKVEQLPDGSLIIEACASVANFIDSDQEYFSPEGLKKYADSWGLVGNLRGQHDAHWPIGTIKKPLIGKLSGPQPGWWIEKHPDLGEDALMVRAHIVDERAINFIKSGTLSCLSVGGSIPVGGRQMVDVEVDERGVVLREIPGTQVSA